MMEVFFIYGTLKEGQMRSSVMDDANYLGTALTNRDFSIFHMGNYPALAEFDSFTQKDRRDFFQKGVWGELYECDSELIKKLDRIEGVPVLYQQDHVELEQICLVRLPTTIETAQQISDKRVKSYFYVDAGSKINLEKQFIESGIWLDEMS